MFFAYLDDGVQLSWMRGLSLMVLKVQWWEFGERKRKTVGEF